MQPLAAHVYAERGAAKSTAASLLNPDLGPLLLTRIEADGNGVALTLLNPGGDTVEARIGAGTLKPAKANRTTLSGEVLEALPVNGKVQFTVAPRAWTRVAIYPA